MYLDSINYLPQKQQAATSSVPPSETGSLKFESQQKEPKNPTLGNYKINRFCIVLRTHTRNFTEKVKSRVIQSSRLACKDHPLYVFERVHMHVDGTCINSSGILGTSESYNYQNNGSTFVLFIKVNDSLNSEIAWLNPRQTKQLINSKLQEQQYSGNLPNTAFTLQASKMQKLNI